LNSKLKIKLIAMKISKTALLNMAVVALLFMLPCIAHAQPGFTDDTTDVPIDGGLSLLVAAGVGYGVKKMQQRKRDRIINNETK
jgi:hypothetical protein